MFVGPAAVLLSLFLFLVGQSRSPRPRAVKPGGRPRRDAPTRFPSRRPWRGVVKVGAVRIRLRLPLAVAYPQW